MARGLVVAVLLTSWVPALSAHSGPPYPVIVNQMSGPYVLSLWTDPDATDDGSAAGQFWVIVRPAAQGTKLPDDTKVIVSAAPIDRDGEAHRGVAVSVDGDPFRRFIALPMGHEGMFAAVATVTGALGNGSVETTVSATYDLRPAPWLLAVYVMPFVLVGALWLMLIVRRHGANAGVKRVQGGDSR